MGRGAWQAIVHEIAKNWTQLSMCTCKHTNTHTNTYTQFSQKVKKKNASKHIYANYPRRYISFLAIRT